MGLLYIALAIIGGGLIVAYIKAWIAVELEEEQGEEGETLPSRAKYSRY
jgi:phage shock protein PspC (stress-responsive transcriptional regulator)